MPIAQCRQAVTGIALSDATTGSPASWLLHGHNSSLPFSHGERLLDDSGGNGRTYRNPLPPFRAPSPASGRGDSMGADRRRGYGSRSLRRACRQWSLPFCGRGLPERYFTPDCGVWRNGVPYFCCCKKKAGQAPRHVPPNVAPLWVQTRMLFLTALQESVLPSMARFLLAH